jgi:hypothetical protein
MIDRESALCLLTVCGAMSLKAEGTTIKAKRETRDFTNSQSGTRHLSPQDKVLSPMNQPQYQQGQRKRSNPSQLPPRGDRVLGSASPTSSKGWFIRPKLQGAQVTTTFDSSFVPPSACASK